MNLTWLTFVTLATKINCADDKTPSNRQLRNHSGSLAGAACSSHLEKLPSRQQIPNTATTSFEIRER